MKKKPVPALLACVLLSLFSGGLNAENGTAESSGCVDLSVLLNKVTLVDKIRWSAQVFIAPEQLETIVPLYAYSSSGMNIQEFIDVLSQDIGVADFLVGRAAVQNQHGHDVWRGTALVELEGRLHDPDQLASSLDPCINEQNADLWYYIVSEPLAHYDEDPTPLWTSAGELSTNSK
ncbi:MAG: hypothetical protein F4X92_07360 [Gammaproteobacteria bacterium]|nr:hypothetical protein [Gammaproteobacteria bacterium]